MTVGDRQIVTTFDAVIFSRARTGDTRRRQERAINRPKKTTGVPCKDSLITDRRLTDTAESPSHFRHGRLVCTNLVPWPRLMGMKRSTARARWSCVFFVRAVLTGRRSFFLYSISALLARSNPDFLLPFSFPLIKKKKKEEKRKVFLVLFSSHFVVS